MTFNPATGNYYRNYSGGNPQIVNETTLALNSLPVNINVQDTDEVANRVYGTTPGTVHVLNGNTHATLNTITGFNPGPMATDALNDRLYVSVSGSSTIREYSGDGVTLLGTFTLPDGYISQTMEMEANENILYVNAYLSGGSLQRRLFALEAAQTSIHGQKFDDFDGDGVHDLNEPGLNGWTIELLDAATGAVVASQVTASIDLNDDSSIDPITEQGLYSFTKLAAGNYEVRELPQENWQQTFPNTFQFSAADSYTTTGDRSEWVVAEDFNGDAHLDLAVGNRVESGGYQVSVFFNDGFGHFASAGSYAAGSIAHSLAAGDVDLDGDADIITVNEGPDTVSVLFNNGSGVFGGRVDYAAGYNPYLIGLGDLDGDGDPDLITGKAGTGQMNVLINHRVEDGSFSFATGVSYSVGVDPRFGTLADVDNDADLDAIVAGAGTSSIAVLQNNGLAGFGAPVTYGVGAGSSPVYVAAGDLDGDGDADLAVPNTWTSNGIYTVQGRIKDDDGGFNEYTTDVTVNSTKDYGDLPAAYNLTTLADDGARHTVGALYLGLAIDTDPDGQESPNADGDDTDGNDDEDGISVVGTWHEGTEGGAVQVVVTGGAGYLSGWFDFNGDNDFDDTGEQVLNMQPVSPGSQTLTFDVPLGAIPTNGTYNRFSRFRLEADNATPLELTGAISGGEVEDHLLQFNGVIAAVSIAANDPNAAEPSDAGQFTVSLPTGSRPLPAA